MRPKSTMRRACVHCGAPFRVRAERAATHRYCSKPCHYADARLPLEVRFWRCVEKTDDCWLWTGPLQTSGYGRLTTDGNKREGAHRLSWQFHYGPIPTGFQVQHICNNRPCVRPDHLTIGTPKENSEYMAACGRSAKGDRNGSKRHPEAVRSGDDHFSRRRPELVLRGSRNGAAKLTEEIVRTMRQQHTAGVSMYRLAKIYSVNHVTVLGIIRRERWKHVD